MGVARFTEVPASLEQVGGGVARRALEALQWGWGWAALSMRRANAGAGAADDAPSFGDRLDEAVWLALAPGAAPTLLLMLAILVGLLRYAFIAASADRMLRASLAAAEDALPGAVIKAD